MLWAAGLVEDVTERAKQLETRLRSGESGQWSKELKHLWDIKRKLDRLSGMDASDEWIITESDVNAESKTMSAVRFDPLSPARYAESALFRGIEKIVLVSATVRPKTAVMLGIDPGDMEFVEYPSTFPVARRMVVHQPTVRMTYLNEQDDGLMKDWLKLLDAWIGQRIALGRKGLIHAVSYRRMRFIMDNSEHSWCMMTHSTHDRARVIAEFRRSDGPRVLISPSVDTGYDFPNNDARFQVVAKIPFSSVTDPVVKARKAKDRDYDLYQAAQTLVQMTGRTTRSESDYSETLLADQNCEWAIPMMKRKGFLPKWWLDAFKSYDVAPPPIQFADEK
jgi:Rad3-related DNA helicase